MPWLVLGDFNNVLSQDDKKKGGLKVTNYDTKDFVDCVKYLDLLDLRFVGCYYTLLSPSVCSKLDRALVNTTWNNSSFNGLAEFIASGCIWDHVLIVVFLLAPHVNKTNPFKFFNMWTISYDFIKIVEDKWFFMDMGLCNIV